MAMNPSDWSKIKQRLPISESTARLNSPDGVASGAEPQCAVQDAPDAAIQRKEKDPTRCRISIVSYRKRLIDPDNLIPKYFIDSLRYLKVIEDDSAKHIVLEVRQEKSKTPRTEIVITPIEPSQPKE